MDSGSTLTAAPVTGAGTRTTPAPGLAVADLLWSRRTWLLLVTLCIVLALDGLDVSMVGVALPSIGQELGLGTGSLQWIVSAYVLGYGALLLLGGRMADLLGRRKVFLVALSVFGLASLLGGLVSDPTLLIATRFIKGLAAAFTAPAGFSIITTNFVEGPARNKAISIYATFGASGYSLGLVVGGFMTELSWRWTFLVSVPVAAVVLLMALRFIPRDRPAAEGGHDIWGALTLAVGMLGLVFTVVQAPDSGWLSPFTIGGFVLSVVVLALFGLIETRTRHPLIRFGILREGWVARANLAAVALFGSYLSFQFIVTLFLQSVLGWAPLSMALALLPAGLLVVSSAPFADKLIDRFGATRLIVVGLTALTAGYAWFLRIGPDINYVVDVLPSVLLLGVGFALGFPAINVQATAGIHDDEQGLAAGLIQSSTQVGAALVLAVTTAIVTSGAHGGSPTHDAAAMLAQFRPGLVLSMVVAVVGLAVALAPQRRKALAEAGVAKGAKRG